MAMRRRPLISPNAERSAAIFGCTVEQAKSLMGKNAAVLTAMAEKAERTGKRQNGYTAGELRASAESYRVAALS